jgi:hypothetical protein
MPRSRNFLRAAGNCCSSRGAGTLAGKVASISSKAVPLGKISLTRAGKIADLVERWLSLWPIPATVPNTSVFAPGRTAWRIPFPIAAKS